MTDEKPISASKWLNRHRQIRALHRPMNPVLRNRAKQRRWYWRHKAERILAKQGLHDAPATA